MQQLAIYQIANGRGGASKNRQIIARALYTLRQLHVASYRQEHMTEGASNSTWVWNS